VFADQHYRAVEKQGDFWQTTIYNIYKDGKLFLENLEVDVAGPFQTKNVATVMQALEGAGPSLNLWRPDKPSKPTETASNEIILREALKNLRQRTKFIGRWQIIGENPTILCDSAHNEAGLRLAFETIQKHFEGSEKSYASQCLHIVTGFVNDKDVDKALGFFPKHARYYFAKANIPRGLDASVLQDQAAGFGLKGLAYTSVRNALKAARRAAFPNDLIVVIGSIFVVGEVV
jgi:dihydrofolate synthase/folylpolyglutamate synthase